MREIGRKREKRERKGRKAKIRPSFGLAAVEKLDDLVESYVVVSRKSRFLALRLFCLEFQVRDLGFLLGFSFISLSLCFSTE